MEKAGIYKITNTANGRIYIGSAVYLVRRFTEHKRQLRKGIHPNRFLQNAWVKYGENAFEFAVVEFVAEISLLIEREQFWIDETKCFEKSIGYNLSPTAKSILGYRFSDEQRAKVSAGLKGKKKTLEHRANVWKNRIVTIEFSAKMAENGKMRKGKKFSESHKAKKALAQTGEKNHRAKLTANQIQDIKRRLQKGELGKYLAIEYKVADTTISKIKNGQRWANL